MGRGANKKKPVTTRASLETKVSLCEPAPTRDVTPTQKYREPLERERASVPRTTTDNPWRDLHPTRIWPD